MNSENAHHTRFMEQALVLAADALAAGEFPVGCVLVHRNAVIASAARVNSGPEGNELDHAEILALRRLERLRPRPDLGEVTLYSTMEPCLMCFSTLILNGIRTIVYGYEDAMGGGSGLDLSSLPPLYAGMKVDIVSGVCRGPCLELFKRFFADRRNAYWRDSHLAAYTLAQ